LSHYVTLSPFEAPVTYVLFFVTWISSLFCIFISFYFRRTKNENWWLLIALAFALPLIFEVSICLSHGVPPLPYTLVLPDQTMRSLNESSAAPDNSPLPFTKSLTTFSVSRVQWSFFPPLMAIAFGWAYLADRRKWKAP